MGGCWFLVLWLAAPVAAPVQLRARLTLLDAQPALGQPVRLRLELTNSGGAPISYEAAQVSTIDSLDVVGPGGARAPNVYGSFQVGEAESTLEPGKTAVLFDGLDLAEHYHLATSGRYRVQFSGRGLEVDGRPVTIASNVVELELRPGRRPAATEVVERLLPLLPEGWELGRGTRPGEIEIVINGLVRSKRDQARVVLWLTEAKPEGRPEARLWGRTAWGRLWGSSNRQAGNGWPGHRKAVSGALAVRPGL